MHQTEQFTRALDLMNRSLAVGGQVDFTPPVMTPILAAPPPVQETVVPHGFRELIVAHSKEFCAFHLLTDFMPGDRFSELEMFFVISTDR